MIYSELILITLIVTYIVDVSGFTESWRGAVGRLLPPGKRLGNLRPFDCSACMTWWSCLIYTLAAGEFSLATVAFSALMSLMSSPVSEGLVLIRELCSMAMRKLMDKILN